MNSNNVAGDGKSLIYQYLTATVHTNPHDKDGASPITLVFTSSNAANQTEKILVHLFAMKASILNCYFFTCKAAPQCMMQQTLKVAWCAEQGPLLRHLVHTSADSSVSVFIDTKQPHPVKLW
jgi:hypothetical protein